MLRPEEAAHALPSLLRACRPRRHGLRKRRDAMRVRAGSIFRRGEATESRSRNRRALRDRV